MRALSSKELLDRWERAVARPPVERSVALLAAEGDGAWAESAGMPLGQRDATLLALRVQVFGPELNCLAACPECQTQVEFSVLAEYLRLPVVDANRSLSIQREGVTVTFRVLNTADLIAASTETTLLAARRSLFARCLLSALNEDGTEADLADIPDDLVKAVGDRIAEVDPQADLVIALRCPQCAGAWDEPFDLAAFVWQEVHAWARRVLREVHEMASFYGWNEAEILALSPMRRHAYLELIRA